MTFFRPSLIFRRPAWLAGERGPDVSPYLDWYPIVTFLQVACDLPMATSVPTGYGHNIAPANYIDGEMLRRRLEDAGIRANLASTLDGPRVMVWPQDAERAREVLTP